MAQAGMHALVGAMARKLAPKRNWFMLGVILGSLFPDLDNYAVAAATIAKLDTHGLHRTYTHSLFAILVVAALFLVTARVSRQPRWTGFGIGAGVGIGLHIVLDLLLWFNGVELLWPLGGWVNLWENTAPPDWFTTLLEPAEFLFFALFFGWLAGTANAQKTDISFLGTLRWWMIAMAVLLAVFTPLAYLMVQGYQTVYGAAYLVSLTAAVVIAIRMRDTIEFAK